MRSSRLYPREKTANKNPILFVLPAQSNPQWILLLIYSVASYSTSSLELTSFLDWLRNMGGGAPKEHLLCLVPQEEPKALIDHLRHKFPAIEITYRHISFTFDKDVLRKEIPPALWETATILCTFHGLPEKLEWAPHLKLLQLLSAGSNHVQGTPVWDNKDIVIATSSGIHGPQIAEWAVAQHLVQTHGLRKFYDLQKEHRWGGGSGYKDTVRDRVGLRVGVLGYGSIGRQIGRVSKAMGMSVFAYTATPKDTKEQRRDGGYIVPDTGDPQGEVPDEWFSGLDKASLHRFLAQDLDWLIVSVPLTDQTHHMLSTEEFQLLGRRKAFVTNIARGQIIDQPALIEALKTHTLSGAALDVTDPEPLNKDSELWDLDNVIVTPHISGIGSNYTERALGVLELNLERWLNGERLINVVDRERGY